MVKINTKKNVKLHCNFIVSLKIFKNYYLVIANFYTLQIYKPTILTYSTIKYDYGYIHFVYLKIKCKTLISSYTIALL